MSRSVYLISHLVAWIQYVCLQIIIGGVLHLPLCKPKAYYKFTVDHFYGSIMCAIVKV